MGKDIYDVKTYAKFANKSFSWKYLESPVITRILKEILKPQLKVVEAGSGEGRLVELLISLGVDEENITAIDLSEYLLEIGKKRFPKATWLCGSIGEEIGGVKEGENDLVVSSMVLDYLDNQSYVIFLENARKWLKNDGKLLLIFPHPVRMASDLSRYFERKLGSNKTPWGENVPYYHRTVGDYLNRIIEAGFKIREVIEPELPNEAKEDVEAFKKYSACPMRLAVWAERSIIT